MGGIPFFFVQSNAKLLAGSKFAKVIEKSGQCIHHINIVVSLGDCSLRIRSAKSYQSHLGPFYRKQYGTLRNKYQIKAITLKTHGEVYWFIQSLLRFYPDRLLAYILVVRNCCRCHCCWHCFTIVPFLTRCNFPFCLFFVYLFSAPTDYYGLDHADPLRPYVRVSRPGWLDRRPHAICMPYINVRNKITVDF